jgi:beta-N-acetylhexosaminidase
VISFRADFIVAAAQTTQLVLDLQTLAHNAGHPVPLLIAIDQENGGVNSLFDEVYVRQFPSAMGMAAAGSRKLAKDVARATAQELSSCGINWILGPVLDVLTNARNQPLGVRSIGDDPQEVSAYGVECMKGYQEAGLATCGKHFPSYGNLEFFGPPTDVPTITDSLESLSQSALVPFRNAIGEGIDTMMVGGVAMSSSFVNVMHACLSEQIVRDLLRHEMGFEGVVVSECLEMEALTRNIGISGGTVMAFKAGCDLILTCRSLSVQEEAINGLKAGIDNGMIERYRVQESVQRILALKHKYTSWEKAFSPLGVENLTRLQPLHTSLSTAAYNKSITVVRDQKRYLPLSKLIRSDEELLLLTPLVKPLPASATYRHLHEQSEVQNADHTLEFDTNTSVMSGEKVFRELGRGLARQRNGKVAHTSYTANGVRPVHESLLVRAGAVIVVTADAGRNMYQNGFAKHISMMCKLSHAPNGQYREKPCIVVAVSSPFDFAADQTIGTYICTYDFTETALRALVKIMYGELAPAGSLPGSVGQRHQTKHVRQQWLVENFKEERDAGAVDVLLQQAQKDTTASSQQLQGVTTTHFLLRQPTIEESHFVVRNSSTKELFGFCATYFSTISGIGHIAAIVVDPQRRKLSIGHSLHDRAIRALMQKKGIKRFHLGSRLPGIFAGIPKGDLNEYKVLRPWFAKLGWNVSLSTSVCSMTIRDLNIWSPPDGLGKSLTSADIKYDLVYGSEYADAISDHLKRSARSDVLDIYKLALSNKDSSGIIRAKRASDGAILGSLLCCRSDSKIASFMPGFGQNASKGLISSPVISPTVTDQQAMLQGLVLLAVRQSKRQGVSSVVFDYVSIQSPTYY